MHRFMEANNVYEAVPYSADVFNSGFASDRFSLANYDEITFLLWISDSGGTGTGTVEVVASTAATSGTSEDIPFKYRKQVIGTGVWGDLTDAAAAGVTTVAADVALFAITVKAEDLPAGKTFVSIKGTEVVNEPVPGFALAVLSRPRYAGADLANALS